MRTLHPKVAVLSGAAVGLIAGTAVYGVVSTNITNTRPRPTDKVAAVSLAVAPARAPVTAPVPAHCAKGATLQGRVCIVHVQRVVQVEHVIHVPAAQPAAQPAGQNQQAGQNGQAGQTGQSGQAVRSAGSSSSGASTSPAPAQPPPAPVQAAASQHGEPADAESEKAPTGGGDH